MVSAKCACGVCADRSSAVRTGVCLFLLVRVARSFKLRGVGMAATKCSLWAAQAATKGGSKSWPEDGVASMRERFVCFAPTHK